MSSETLHDLSLYITEQGDRTQLEAREQRVRLLEVLHSLLGFALRLNAEEYIKLEQAIGAGDSQFLFHYYAVTSDADEKMVRFGSVAVPAVLFALRNQTHSHPDHQLSTTQEVVVAIPTSDEFCVTDDTTIDDVPLSSTVYLYWAFEQGDHRVIQVGTEGVSDGSYDDEEAAVADFIERINAQDISTLSTGAALVSRLLQDVSNLALTPHQTSMIRLTDSIADD